MLGRSRSLFRRHRSQKDLRSAAEVQAVPMHNRQHSTSSSTFSRTSTDCGRPSTSRGEHTTAWEPLHSHPPMVMARPPSVFPHHGDRIQDHNESDESTPRPQRHRSFRELQAATGHSLEIYDGFDFGFDTKKATSPTPPTTTPRRILLVDATKALPVPVTSAWSSPTLSSSASSTATWTSDDDGPGTPGSSPAGWGDSSAVTPRPHPADFNTPDYFIARGGWKRRGIVFVSEEEKVTEDDCFDIP